MSTTRLPAFRPCGLMPKLPDCPRGTTWVVTAPQGRFQRPVGQVLEGRCWLSPRSPSSPIPGSLVEAEPALFAGGLSRLLCSVGRQANGKTAGAGEVRRVAGLQVARRASETLLCSPGRGEAQASWADARHPQPTIPVRCHRDCAVGEFHRKPLSRRTGIQRQRGLVPWFFPRLQIRNHLGALRNTRA